MALDSIDYQVDSAVSRLSKCVYQQNLVSVSSLRAMTFKNVFVRGLSMATIDGCQIAPLKFQDSFQ